MRTYLSVFASVLIAEMGDKTQLAAMLFASDSRLSPIGILIAASAAIGICAIGIWMLFTRGV